MNGARRITEILYRFEKAAALMAFSVMTLVIIADILSRKITGSGIAGAPRIAVYAMITAAFISFGLASHRGTHLRPRFADNWLPMRWQGGIIRLQEFLTAAFCVVFAVVAAQVVYETYQLQETSRMLRIAIWPLQTVMPLAFLIGAIRHGLYALYPDIRPGERVASGGSSSSDAPSFSLPKAENTERASDSSPHQAKEGGASHASGGSSSSEGTSDSSPHQAKEASPERVPWRSKNAGNKSKEDLS